MTAHHFWDENDPIALNDFFSGKIHNIIFIHFLMSLIVQSLKNSLGQIQSFAHPSFLDPK